MDTDRWQQLTSLFHAALEQPKTARADFLARACGSDAELLKEINLLVEAHEETEHLIDQPAFARAGDLFDNETEYLIGQSIGHYQIISPLGRGGMGEVYLALDSKLGRKVALKMLPARFTEAGERLSRFIQEAKVASALNHPNIITIHEIGQVAGIHYIATEYVEGITLRKLLLRGRLGFDEALEIAVQAAGALAAAHRAGIIHRDIKPENIMRRSDAYVKVLDFGLATLTERAGADAPASQPSISWVDTEPGVVMGTIKYMSPEQTRGTAVSAATDVFSLGVVIHEMVTGRHPFERETKPDVMAAILAVDPPPLTPFLSEPAPELQVILNKALRKEPAQRYQICDEFFADLQRLKEERDFAAKLIEHSGSGIRAANYSRRMSLTSPFFLVSLTGLLLLIGIAVWLVTGRSRKPDAALLASFRFVPVAEWRAEPGDDRSWARFSPNGAMIAFSSHKSGTSKIWIRQVIGADAIQITKENSEDIAPIWSPDGQRIAFASRKPGGGIGIYSIPALDGSAPTLLRSLDEARILPVLVAWSRRDRIYYESAGNLYALEPSTRNPSRVTTFSGSAVNASSFSVSPQEDRIAYVATVDGQTDVWTMSINGTPVKVTDDKLIEISPVWHPDGKRLLYSSLKDGTFQVFASYLDGEAPLQLTFRKEDCEVADVSPDGSKLLFGSSEEEAELWSANVDSGEESELTSETGVELWPDVSPDGKMLAYQFTTAPRSGSGIFNNTILRASIASRGDRLPITRDGFDPKWSPDGKSIAFLRSYRTSYDLFTVSAAGGSERRITTRGVYFSGFVKLSYARNENTDYSWSPDGTSIAYSSRESGFSNIFTVVVDDLTEATISQNTNSTLRLVSPLWSPDGKRIAYVARPSGGGATTRTVWIYDHGKSTPMLESPDDLKLIGWSRSGDSLLLIKRPAAGYKIDVQDLMLISLSTRDRDSKMLTTMKEAREVSLSRDGTLVAFTSREDGRDNVWVTPITGGQARKLTANSGTRLFVSSLVWSPDSKVIYFGKQWKKHLISMIDNFTL